MTQQLKTTTTMELDRNIEDIITELQELLGTNSIGMVWKPENKTNKPDGYTLSVGGYFDGKKKLPKIEIKITK